MSDEEFCSEMKNMVVMLGLLKDGEKDPLFRRIPFKELGLTSRDNVGGVATVNKLKECAIELNLDVNGFNGVASKYSVMLTYIDKDGRTCVIYQDHDVIDALVDRSVHKVQIIAKLSTLVEGNTVEKSKSEKKPKFATTSDMDVIECSENENTFAVQVHLKQNRESGSMKNGVSPESCTSTLEAIEVGNESSSSNTTIELNISHPSPSNQENGVAMVVDDTYRNNVIDLTVCSCARVVEEFDDQSSSFVGLSVSTDWNVSQPNSFKKEDSMTMVVVDTINNDDGCEDMEFVDKNLNAISNSTLKILGQHLCSEEDKEAKIGLFAHVSDLNLDGDHKSRSQVATGTGTANEIERANSCTESCSIIGSGNKETGSDDIENNDFPEMGFYILDDCQLHFSVVDSNSITKKNGQSSSTADERRSCLTNTQLHPTLPSNQTNRKGWNKAVTSDCKPVTKNSCQTQTNVANNYCADCQVSFVCFCKDNKVKSYGTCNNTEYLQLNLSSVSYFNGSVDDMSCSKCKKKRSDLSLLLGMIRFCQGVVTLCNCYIRKKVNRDVTNKIIPNQQSSDVDGSLVYEVIVTVSFPRYFVQKPDQFNRRSIMPSESKLKRLHPATQCLLALIQSDWNLFDQIVVDDASNAKQQQDEIPSIDMIPTDLPLFTTFPNQITLDELYKQIGGNCRKKLQAIQDSSSDNNPTSVPGFKNQSIQLYPHQIESLEWMKCREVESISEQACWKYHCHNSSSYSLNDEYQNCRQDCHRTLTGGQTVLLSLRKRSEQDNTEGTLSTMPSCRQKRSKNVNWEDYVRLDQVTGQQILLDDNDDESYEQRMNVFAARGGLLCDDPGLGKTITMLALILQTSGLSTGTVDHGPSGMDSNSSIRDNKNRSNTPSTRINDDDIFETYWEQCVGPDFRKEDLYKLLGQLCNSKMSKEMQEPIGELRDWLSEVDFKVSFYEFEQKVVQIIVRCCKEGGDATLLDRFQLIVSKYKKAKLTSPRFKSYSNLKSRSNSDLAKLMEKRTKQRLVDSLYPSCATLLVIPNVLVEHWQKQIEDHVDLYYFYGGNKSPIYFIYEPNSTTVDMDDVTFRCQVAKTHAAVVFVDKSENRELPPPEFLAMFRIVIVPTSRFKNENKNGSLEDELEQNVLDDDDDLSFNAYKLSACPLLKIHWLRMIVDEGHAMGSSATKCNTIRFASWIQAQRLWVVTGTPTKQTNVQIMQLKNLFSFLRHGFFSNTIVNNDWWKRHIAKSWRNRELVSFYRLRSLLGFFCKRHSKRGLLDVPKHNVKKITMSSVEVLTYNTLVAGIQANIVTTSMPGKTSGFKDSLLNDKEAILARKAIKNVLCVCIGWAHVIPTLSDERHRETMQLVNKRFGSESDESHNIARYLARAQNEESSQCHRCGTEVTILLLMPCCCGLVCTECMRRSTKQCLVCKNIFDIDEFQKWQPGFGNRWLSNLTKNQSVADEGWDEHQCNLMNESRKCNLCGRCSKECPEHESKPSYLIKRLLQLYYSSQDNVGLTRPFKAIVFAKLRKDLDVIGDRLIRRFGTACVAEYWGPNRLLALDQFTNNNHCFCLLLTKDGSEGLDLSFVTHIFFVEVINDQSVEEQVIARAWRMGASGPVEVETLIADNTIEVEMLQYKFSARNICAMNQTMTEDKNSMTLEQHSVNLGVENNRCLAPTDKLRIKSLLLSLRLIRNGCHDEFDKPQTLSESLNTITTSTTTAHQKKRINTNTNDDDDYEVPENDNTVFKKRVRFGDLYDYVDADRKKGKRVG